MNAQGAGLKDAGNLMMLLSFNGSVCSYVSFICLMHFLFKLDSVDMHHFIKTSQCCVCCETKSV